MIKHLHLAILLVCPLLNWAQAPQTPIQLKKLSSYHTNVFDDGAAEITAYDETTQRLFFTNASTNEIGILDVSDPFNMTLFGNIDISSFGGGVNSVVVWSGFVAVAVENTNKQLDGEIVFFDTDGNYINQVTVGPLPDMITISPDQSKLVVANEGEPSDDYTVDPKGSVSIIDISSGVAGLSASNVITTEFSDFESYRQSFELGLIDNWNYTASPAVYNTHGDSLVSGSEDVWSTVSSFSGNINNPTNGSVFWGMQDLDNTNGGGNFWHTLDFDAVDLSLKPEATLSFKYYSVGFESTDSIGYVVAFDNGSVWEMLNYVDLNKDTTWSTISITIPASANYVRIRLMAKQNGASDYAGFDDIKLSFLDESTRIFGNNDLATVSQDIEPEYICVNDASTHAIVVLQENNSYAKVNLVTGKVEQIKGFGFKDHSVLGNGMDVSNTAATVNITTWPVKGLYLPDALNCYSVGGMNYFVTANEGDSRDYGGYSEEDRVKDLILDSIFFPNYATLQLSDELGRLKTTLSMGDIDYDGEFEEIYSYGARSFSIWDNNGNLVYDSGDDFEQITYQEIPAYFNSTNDDNNSFKNRSDDKGPEPEGLVIAEINNRKYAFIGLERVGGIMVYDISDPNAVSFIQYLNNRDFTQLETDSAAFDLAPEGLIFIPKTNNPIKRDLLVVSNEVSGTITIYQIDINNTINGDVTLEDYSLTNPVIIGTYGDTIYEGGISGMHFKHGSSNEYLLITDRGPNVTADAHPLAMGQKTKFFPFPSYAPKIMDVSLVAGEIVVNNTTELKRPDGTSASGIPLPLGFGSTGEQAWSDTMGTIVAPDVWGVDSEGIVEDNNGNYWICDEYGASVWRLDENFRAIERYSPFPAQPEDVAIDSMVGKRRPNRGFEGVTYTPNGKIYAILQSPIYNPSSSASDSSRIHRILEVDPNTGIQQMYAYEHQDPIGEIRNKDWKIGDLVALNNDEFLVLEHAERRGWNYKDVFKINLANATPIVVEDFGGQSLEELGDSISLAAVGINTVAKEHVLDLLENGWDFIHDKPEGITIIDNNTIAIVNDNDYGIDAPNEDADIMFTGKQTKIYVYGLPFGLNYETPYCEVGLGPDTTVCPNENVNLDAGSGFVIFNWSTSDTTQQITTNISGNIFVEAQTAIGCVATDTVVISNFTIQPIDLGEDSTICESNNIVLDAGPGFLTYSWSTGGSGQTESISGTNLGIGSHIVSVTTTDANDCVNSDDIEIVVDACTNLATFDLKDLKVFPNPTRSNLNVVGYIAVKTNVELFDPIGKVVQTSIISAGTSSVNFDVKDLNGGLYYLKLSTKESQRTVKVIVQ